MQEKKIIIAIDGHSSCGKSTMAKSLARRIGYVYVDTGAMYRAVALYAMEQGFLVGGQLDEEALRRSLPQIHISFVLDPHTSAPRTQLNGRDVEERIRMLDVSSCVSKVASLGFVREAMVRQQQEMGAKGGIVMDGRDIGTVVFPSAELKIFVTASPEVRAQRRYDELVAKGQEVSYEAVLKNVEERDYLDSHRALSPLQKAPDALLLDNSRMSIAQQEEWLFERFQEAVRRVSE